MHAFRLTALIPLALLAAAGCGEPAVYPVKGVVLFEGKPMAGGGSIAFVPVGNQLGKTAGGEIAADGTFEMTTHSPGDGSMPGEFRVVIHQSVEQEGAATRDGEKVGKRQAAVAPEDRIPAVYFDQLKSPVVVTVEKKALNTVTIELKRK